MTESTFNVYDLFHPSPNTLKEISSFVVAVELWREEIGAHVGSKGLQKVDLSSYIQLETTIHEFRLPSTVQELLEEHVDRVRGVICKWWGDHPYSRMLSRGPVSPMTFLCRFDDLAWDWNGTIHEVRTAKRMVLCDRLTEDEKFQIACFYCLEDDIKRIWPLVSARMNLDEINFQIHPQLHYWICCLRNELHKVPNPHDESVDEVMLEGYNRNYFYVKYFWDRLSSDVQLEILLQRFGDWQRYADWRIIFARFFLSKLNKQQLEVFLEVKGADLILFMLGDVMKPSRVLEIWMYIRNEINASNFIRFIDHLQIAEISDTKGALDENVLYLAREIWKSAPQHLKRAVLDHLLFNDRLPFFLRVKISPRQSRKMKMLIVVLQDATLEERNAFWHKNWRNLIGNAPGEGLIVTMKLCFRDENEITLFNEDVMSKYENIPDWCFSLLRCGFFEELNDFLYFCCPDVQKRRQLKRQLLWLNYVAKNSVFTIEVIKNNKSLNAFVNDAFHDAADLGVEFRNQFASFPETHNLLFACFRLGHFVPLMEFVDTFFLREQVALALKRSLVEYFKKRLIAGRIPRIDCIDNVKRILVWLLGCEDEVVRFKQSIPPENIFRAAVQVKRRDVKAQRDEKALSRCSNFLYEFHERLNIFLSWYFDEYEVEIEEFKKRFLDEADQFILLKRRRVV